jgi:hypothetical protein
MRVALVALALSIGAIIVLGLSDISNSWMTAGPLLLLICLPISLALFAFLSHYKKEEEDSSP